MKGNKTIKGTTKSRTKRGKAQSGNDIWKSQVEKRK